MSKRFSARKKFVRRKHKIKLVFYIFIVLFSVNRCLVKVDMTPAN